MKRAATGGVGVLKYCPLTTVSHAAGRQMRNPGGAGLFREKTAFRTAYRGPKAASRAARTPAGSAARSRSSWLRAAGSGQAAR